MTTGGPAAEDEGRGPDSNDAPSGFVGRGGWHLVAFLAALVLILALSIDWYTTEQGEEYRRVEDNAAGSRQVEPDIDERAAQAAEEQEKTAWQADAFVDRLVLLACLAAFIGAVISAFMRSAGRRQEPPWNWSAIATVAGVAATGLILYRMIQPPGIDEASVIKPGAPLGLVAVGVLTIASRLAVLGERDELSGDADEKPPRRGRVRDPEETAAAEDDKPRRGSRLRLPRRKRGAEGSAAGAAAAPEPEPAGEAEAAANPFEFEFPAPPAEHMEEGPEQWREPEPEPPEAEPEPLAAEAEPFAPEPGPEPEPLAPEPEPFEPDTAAEPLSPEPEPLPSEPEPQREPLPPEPEPEPLPPEPEPEPLPPEPEPFPPEPEPDPEPAAPAPGLFPTLDPEPPPPDPEPLPQPPDPDPLPPAAEEAPSTSLWHDPGAEGAADHAPPVDQRPVGAENPEEAPPWDGPAPEAGELVPEEDLFEPESPGPQPMPDPDVVPAEDAPVGEPPVEDPPVGEPPVDAPAEPEDELPVGEEIEFDRPPDDDPPQDPDARAG